jgi:hypothetical protein
MCSTRNSTGTLLLILDIRVREPLEILGTTVHTTHGLLTWIDLLFFARNTPAPSGLTGTTSFITYVTDVWRNELPLTALFNSAPVHCEIWKFDCIRAARTY